jgi:hypothetical protein
MTCAWNVLEVGVYIFLGAAVLQGIGYSFAPLMIKAFLERDSPSDVL